MSGIQIRVKWAPLQRSVISFRKPHLAFNEPCPAINVATAAGGDRNNVYMNRLAN